MQPSHMAHMPFYPPQHLPPLGPYLTCWLPPMPSFDPHQSPDLYETPSSPPSSSSAAAGLRGLASATLAYAHTWPMAMALQPHQVLTPLLPAPTSAVVFKYESPSSSPTRTTAAPKRKRVGQEPADSHTSSAARGHAATSVQVVKWKLNAPRYKRSKVETAGGGSEWKRCEHCGTDSTPEWRTGPLGKGTLCNACGLRYRTKLREQKKRESTTMSSGSVPMSLLLNPVSTPNNNKKARANVNNPMIWETKVSSFQIADLLNGE